MKYCLPLLFALSAVLLGGCSAFSTFTGPIRSYAGPPLPKDKLAIITVPAALEMRTIDGKEVKSPSMLSGSYAVQLKPGHHLITFRYQLFWGTNDTGMMITSKDVGVDAQFKAGQSYAIRYKVPQDADQASNFLTDFNATLVNLNTGQKYASYYANNLDALLIAKHIGMNAASTGPSSSAQSTTSQPMPNAQTATTADPVKRLKFWWLMASPQQRKDFLDWTKSATESFAPGSDKTPATAPAGTINGVKIKP